MFSYIPAVFSWFKTKTVIRTEYFTYDEYTRTAKKSIDVATCRHSNTMLYYPFREVIKNEKKNLRNPMYCNCFLQAIGNDSITTSITNINQVFPRTHVSYNLPTPESASNSIGFSWSRARRHPIRTLLLRVRFANIIIIIIVFFIVCV